MPPREPQLPEGTDQIINGASAGNEGGSGGFVATSSKNDTGGQSEKTTEKIASQVREQVVSLRGQATDKLRGFADDGKGKASGLLGDIADIIEDAARSIDERLGSEYGDYAHRASGAVSSFAGKVREKSVDEIVDNTRDVVRKSPTVALAAAAVVGFALMRVLRTGIEEGSGTGGTGSSKGGRKRSESTGD